MSTKIPVDEKEVIRSLLYWDLSEEHDEVNDLEAISQVFEEHPSLENFVNEQFDLYMEHGQRHDYYPSWRRWKRIVHTKLSEDYGRGRIQNWCEEALEDVRKG